MNICVVIVRFCPVLPASDKFSSSLEAVISRQLSLSTVTSVTNLSGFPLWSYEMELITPVGNKKPQSYD